MLKNLNFIPQATRSGAAFTFTNKIVGHDKSSKASPREEETGEEDL